jgi:hypothetical protein
MILRLWPALVLCTVLAGPAFAEPPGGTKNFVTPGAVPNYFSNEAGAPLGSGGIVHPHMPRPAVIEEEEEEPPPRATVAAAHHRSVHHFVSAKRKRHETRVASARDKHRGGRHAEGKRTRTASAKSGSKRQAAGKAASRSRTIKAAQGHSAPAKQKQQSGRHAG